MASNSNEISIDNVENLITVRQSLMSSFLRSPFFRHKGTPPTPRGADHLTSEYNTSEFESESESESESVEVLDNMERKRVAKIMKAGFQLLLSSEKNYDPLQHTLLGLKVIMEIEHEQIQGDFDEEYLAVPTSHGEFPTYELKAEEAVGLLLDYAGFWIHSCSIVLADLSTLSERILSSDLRGRVKAKYNQPSSDNAEVVFCILVDGHIEDAGISNSEQLKKFLSELNEKKILKVHATCLSVTVKEDNSMMYSHQVIPRSLDDLIETQ